MRSAQDFITFYARLTKELLGRVQELEKKVRALEEKKAEPELVIEPRNRRRGRR